MTISNILQGNRHPKTGKVIWPPKRQGKQNHPAGKKEEGQHTATNKSVGKSRGREEGGRARVACSVREYLPPFLSRVVLQNIVTTKTGEARHGPLEAGRLGVRIKGGYIPPVFPPGKHGHISPTTANKKETRRALIGSKHGAISKEKKAATYSPTICSTIGATGLNFSVRNGKRWNPGAITTWKRL